MGKEQEKVSGQDFTCENKKQYNACETYHDRDVNAAKKCPLRTLSAAPEGIPALKTGEDVKLKP